MMEMGSAWTRRTTGVKGSPCFSTRRNSLRACVAWRRASIFWLTGSDFEIVLGNALMLFLELV